MTKLLIVDVLAAFVLLAGSHQEPPQDRLVPTPSEARVDDVVVEGQRIETAARAFVEEIAAPAGRRPLARWRRDVCVGVVNLPTETAQYMVDRISTVATDLGLDVGEPGCAPNIVVIATMDGKAVARHLVSEKPRNFDTGASGTNQGTRALNRFQEADRPVRWWQISFPTDTQSGVIATRIPGQINGDGTEIYDYAPLIRTAAASRLISQIRDDLHRSVVIIDFQEVGSIDLSALSDYVAMVSLAQIDPEADTTGYNSVLNLFDKDIAPEATLTAWDRAYLQGLYAARQDQVSRNAQVTAVAQQVVRNRRAISAEESD